MRSAWALKINGRIRDISLVKKWRDLGPTVANRRKVVVPIWINEIPTCGCGLVDDVGVTCKRHTPKTRR